MRGGNHASNQEYTKKISDRYFWDNACSRDWVKVHGKYLKMVEPGAMYGICVRGPDTQGSHHKNPGFTGLAGDGLKPPPFDV